jgi:hypothetical protein
MARRLIKNDNRNKELNKSDYKRGKNSRKKILSVIIACEDECSAPTYFRMILSKLIEDKKITQDSLVIADHHHNTPTGVLNDLISHKVENKIYKDFEHKWIVIDRDAPRVNGGGHSTNDFNTALIKAKQLSVEVAYANDSYELWYLLHFNSRSTSILRDEIITEIIKKLKLKNNRIFKNLNKENIKTSIYTKLIFNEIFELQSNAIRNAENLLKSYGHTHNPEKDNPSTTIHKLVKILNELEN